MRQRWWVIPRNKMQEHRQRQHTAHTNNAESNTSSNTHHKHNWDPRGELGNQFPILKLHPMHTHENAKEDRKILDSVNPSLLASRGKGGGLGLPPELWQHRPSPQLKHRSWPRMVEIKLRLQKHHANSVTVIIHNIKQYHCKTSIFACSMFHVMKARKEK